MKWLSEDAEFICDWIYLMITTNKVWGQVICNVDEFQVNTICHKFVNIHRRKVNMTYAQNTLRLVES